MGIYRAGTHNYYEFLLVESLDSDYFAVNLESLNIRWKSLCSGFFHWFDCNRRKLFINTDSVCKTWRQFKMTLLSKRYWFYAFNWKKSTEFQKGRHHCNTAESTENYPNIRRSWIIMIISNLQKVSSCKPCLALAEQRKKSWPY